VHIKQVPEVINKLPKHPEHPNANFIDAGNAEVVFARYEKGASIEPHFHKTINCGVIIQGEMLLRMDGREEAYGPGDWYSIPAGVEHSSRFETATRSVEIYFKD